MHPTTIAQGISLADFLIDTFTDANGTALAAHTPEVGGPWSTAGGAVTIQGNKVQFTTASPTAFVPGGPGDFDATATVQLGGLTATMIALMFRRIDGSNFWSAEYNASVGRWRVQQFIASVPTLKGQVTKTIDTAVHTIRVKVTGAKLEAWLDGADKITVDPMTAGSEEGGFGLWANSPVAEPITCDALSVLAI